MGQTLRDRREAYARADLEMNFKKFTQELGNATTGKVVANSICYGTNTIESAKKTIALVKKYSLLMVLLKSKQLNTLIKINMYLK